jgi:hypothetical protein
MNQVHSSGLGSPYSYTSATGASSSYAGLSSSATEEIVSLLIEASLPWRGTSLEVASVLETLGYSFSGASSPSAEPY